MAGGAMKLGDPATEDERRLGIYDSTYSQLHNSSSGTREFDKICVIIKYYFSKFSMPWYWVYCIDVNSSSPSDIPHTGWVQSLQPVIRWKLDLSYDAYVILGSKLYFFGRRVRYYDIKSALSSSSNEPTRLRKKSLVKGPPMKGSKRNIVAVVIGDSKICVFGEVLHYNSSPSFELLDTRRFKWKSLPEPFKNYEEHKSVTIKSYCVHGSCLIINTTEKGICVINVAHLQPKWVSLDSGGEKCFPFEGMFAMVDNMLFNPLIVRTWEDPCLYPIKIQSPEDKRESLIDRESLIRRDLSERSICFDERCNNLCIVQAVFPCLLVDIVKFDDTALKKLGSNLSNWESIQSDKSLTFVLTYGHCRSLKITACFPIKTSEIDKSTEEEETLRKKMKEIAEKEGRRKRQMIFRRHLLRTKIVLLKKKKKL